MTDKEKAKELALLLVGEDQNPQPIIDVLLDMAKWKETHVKESAKTQHVNETCKNSGNYLTQEHVNKDFEMVLAEIIDQAQKCVVEPLVVAAQWKDELIKLAKSEEPASEEFEEALAREWQGYNDRGAATVDALEDNTQELAFAKGFYRGAKWQKEKDDEEKVLIYKHGFEDCKEQMMKDAIDACVTDIRTYKEENEVDFTVMYEKGIIPYEIEQEVKVIVIKD